MDMWSFGGSLRVLPLTQQYYDSSAKVVVIAYDTTDLASFNRTLFWYNEYKRTMPGMDDGGDGDCSYDYDSLLLL